MVAGSEASSSLVQAYFGSKAKVDPSELFGQCSKTSDHNAPRMFSGLPNAIGPSAVSRLSTPAGPNGKLDHRQFRQALEAFSPSIEKAALRSLDTAKNAGPSNLALANGGQISADHGNLDRNRSPCHGNLDRNRSPCPSNLVSLIDGCREAVRPRRQTVSSAGASANAALEAKDMESQIRQMVECLKETGAPLPGLLSLAVRKILNAEVSDTDDTDKSCQCPSEISHATTPSWRSRSFPPHYRQVDINFNPAVSSGARATPESAGARRQLPPLPEEATRRRSSPLSEVVRLTDIDSQVHEANAMLVESFLNVKRRALAGPMTPSDASYNSNSSCSAAERSGSYTRDGSAPSSARRFQRKPRQPDMECLLEDGESHIGSEA